MIAWFARNDVAANLLMGTILVLGAVMATRFLVLEIFPSFETDLVSVRIALPGASPEDVEDALAVRIEESLEDLLEVEKIVSRSSEGGVVVTIEGKDSSDIRDVLDDIKTRVDSISSFPADAERPVIELVEFRFEVITVMVAGDLDETEVRQYAEKVRDDLSKIPGMGELELSGVRDYEIIIDVPQAKLQQYDLRLSDVAAAVGGSSLDLSAGNLRTSGGDILVRTRGQAYRRDDFEQIVIRTFPDGSILRVADVAEVIDRFVENNMRVLYNGLPAATIELSRSGEESAIQLAAKVRRYIDQQQALLPKGMVLSYWDDNSQVVKNRLNTLIYNAIQGGILVILLLSLFLRPTVAFPVFLGIPVSFAGALIVMWLLGVSLNIVSLFAFILVLGIVVDDAIITGENIYRQLPTAASSLDAAINGTKEVATPVTFGVLTTVAAFLPIIFTGGSRGPVFAQIPAVIIPALLFSLVESKLILPAHLKWLRKQDVKRGERGRLARFQDRVSGSLERIAARVYCPLLAICVRHRYTTLSCFFGVLLVCLALVLGNWARFVFFPRVQSEEVKVEFTMPAGTPGSVIEGYVERISAGARELRQKYVDPETDRSIIKHIFAATGTSLGGGSNDVMGQVIFELEPPERRSLEVDSTGLLNEWRELNGLLPGTEALSYQAELGRSGNPIDVQLSGQDLQAMEQAAGELKAFLATWPGVFGISDDLSDGKRELYIELRDEAHIYGLTRQNIVRQVRQALYGYEVQRIQRGRDDVRVKVRHPLVERRSVADMRKMLITTPDGGKVPLEQLVELQPGQGPSVITRINRFRTVSVVADIDKARVNMPLLQVELRDWLNAMKSRWPDLQYRFEGEILEQSESFSSMKWGLLFTLFAIYCLLAIPFRSYLQPLIVMSVIPFSLIGIVLGHVLMAKDFSMMSILGGLALVGVVVNDSLLLVDFINRYGSGNRQRLLRSILKAGKVRMRAVVLTSLTTFIGLLPLLFDQSTQAQFLVPMAISLGFGIVFSTLNTLLLVPINFMIMEDIKALFRRWWQQEFIQPPTQAGEVGGG